jgi:hypothetical protein
LLDLVNVFHQPWVRQHVRSRINVIDPIQIREGNRVSKEVSSLKGGIDGKLAIFPRCALNIVKEYGYDRNISSSRAV